MALVAVLTPSLPLWMRACGLSIHIATGPLGIPLLLGALASSLLSRMEEERRQWASILVVSLPLACLWNPEILLSWGDWWSGTSWHVRLLGFLGPMPGVYIRIEKPLSIFLGGGGRGIAVVVFSVAVYALVLGAGLVKRLRQPREPRSLASILVLLGFVLGVLWGRLERMELTTLAPFLAMMAADGALFLWDVVKAGIQPQARRAAALLVLALLVLPIAVGGAKEFVSWRNPSAEKACLEWLESNVGEGEWVVLDPRSPTPKAIRSRFGPRGDEEARYLQIPSHRLRPDLYRGSFWAGWYLPFDHIVLSARTAGPLLERPEAYRDILGFYTEALTTFQEEATFGGEGWRDPKISIMALSGDSLGQGWMERLKAGPMQGLQPDFLQSLGSALGEVDASEEALAVLMRSVSLGNRSASVYANLGALHLSRKEYRDAVAVLDEGLAAFPDHPILLHNKALAFARGGIPRRAVQNFGKLLNVAPWNHDARLDLAAALLLDGQEGRARIVLEDYLKRVPPEKRPDHADQLVRQLLPVERVE
jgi:hypothetical protein